MGIADSLYGYTESEEEQLKVLDDVYERGCTFWDSADVYSGSEELIGKWFKRTGKRNEIFLSTKFGATGDISRMINGDPEYVKIACEKSRQRLGVEVIDLYYAHRADKTVPIERTVGAMAELVKEGKVRYIGLCEVSADTLRRAHAVHPIASLQMEYSPFTLDLEDETLGLLKACRELGVTVVAYSPLGRGLLTGKIRSRDDFGEGDFRADIPKFSKENFPHILKLADGLKALGEKHGATAGQVTLAWILAQGEDIIPIPGTKKIKYLEENLAAAHVKLTAEELKAVRELAAKTHANGPRYSPLMMETMFVNTPPL
jgi:aryl-alcohol dehydrogenase-like predicted oxidoreductase